MIRPLNNSVRLEQHQRAAKGAALLATITMAVLAVLLLFIHQKSSFSTPGLPRISLILLSTLTGLTFLNAIYRIKKLYQFAHHLASLPPPLREPLLTHTSIEPRAQSKVEEAHSGEEMLDLSNYPLAAQKAHRAGHAFADCMISSSCSLLSVIPEDPSPQLQKTTEALAKLLKTRSRTMELDVVQALQEVRTPKKIASVQIGKKKIVTPPERDSFLYKMNQPYLQGARILVDRANEGEKKAALHKYTLLKKRNEARDHLYLQPMINLVNHDQMFTDPFGILSLNLSPEIQAYYGANNILGLLSKNIREKVFGSKEYPLLLNIANGGFLTLVKTARQLKKEADLKKKDPGEIDKKQNRPFPPAFPLKALYNKEIRKNYAIELSSFLFQQVRSDMKKQIPCVAPSQARVLELVLGTLEEIEPPLQTIIGEYAEKMTFGRGKQLIRLLDEMLVGLCEQLDRFAARSTPVTEAEIMGLFTGEQEPFKQLLTKLAQ